MVRRSRWVRGSRVALLLGSLAVLLTGCSAHAIERNLRFGWHTGVTKQAEEMRVLWTWAGVAALAVGAGVWGLIFWACIRYRKKDDALPKQTKFNLPLEIVYSTVPFLIIGVLFWRTVVVEDNVDYIGKNPDVTVQVDAFKWSWQFEYHTYRAGGATLTAAYAGLTNPVDPTLPYYLSTTGSTNEVPVLVLPVNSTVLVDEHSEDVIHSFWVPQFLFKRDVIPYGTNKTTRDNKFEFQPTAEGSFVGRCAELCGTYHAQMTFEVRVVSQQTFQAYLAALAKLPPSASEFAARQSIALKAAGMAPFATTTHPFNPSRTDRSAAQNPGS